MSFYVLFTPNILTSAAVKAGENLTGLFPCFRRLSRMNWPLRSRKSWRSLMTETWRTGSRCCSRFIDIPAFHLDFINVVRPRNSHRLSSFPGQKPQWTGRLRPREIPAAAFLQQPPEHAAGFSCAGRQIAFLQQLHWTWNRARNRLGQRRLQRWGVTSANQL